MNSPRRAWLLLPLALLHLLLLGWLARQHARPGGALPAALTVVRLLTEHRPPAPPRPTPARIGARAPLPVIVPIAPPRLDIATLNAITATPAAALPSPTAPNATDKAKPAPLNLALPAAPPASAPWRNPALADPRANTRRADFGARMADAIGADQTLRVNSLSNGDVVVRQGSECLVAHESRITQIDPMNERTRSTPRAVNPCK